MTTAQLRALGYDAARACNWAEAARLYQEAADAYPMPLVGAMAKADHKRLLTFAAEYRRAAEYAEAHQ